MARRKGHFNAGIVVRKGYPKKEAVSKHLIRTEGY
jgi:hypothetical protein